MRVGCWVVVVVLGLVACAPAIPPLPSRGGPVWLEVKSEHVTLWTDASAERGRAIAREMERRRLVILGAMGQPASRGARVLVIAVRNRAERAVYIPLNYDGMAWGSSNLTGQPGLLIAADDPNSERIVNHEMAHVTSFEMIANQPRWLAEGIASYFDMIDLFSDDTTVEVGRPRDDYGQMLRRAPPLPAADLFECADYKCSDRLFYATSWAVVSFLINERYDQFMSYLQRLNALPHDGPARPWYEAIRESSRERWRGRQAQAWHEAFPDLPPDRLTRELGEWLITGKLRLPHIQATLPPFSVSERTLGDAEVLAVRSWLRLHFTGDGAAARGDAEAALALDRTNVLARLIEAAFTHAIAPEDARATAAAHPDDWRALRLVELALHGTAEGNAAHDRLCAMAGGAPAECPRAPGGT